jgi:hypothetical protein
LRDKIVRQNKTNKIIIKKNNNQENEYHTYIKWKWTKLEKNIKKKIQNKENQLKEDHD